MLHQLSSWRVGGTGTGVEVWEAGYQEVMAKHLVNLLLLMIKRQAKCLISLCLQGRGWLSLTATRYNKRSQIRTGLCMGARNRKGADGGQSLLLNRAGRESYSLAPMSRKQLKKDLEQDAFKISI